MRNSSIDILKFICAVLVIFIHTPQPAYIEPYIDPIRRCAVPVFFIISGFLTYGKTDIDNIIRKRLNSIFRIFCWSLLLYFILKVLHNGLHDVLNMLQHTFISFICCNNIIIAEPLWYIHAYLYVLVIIWVVNKYNLYRFLFFVTPILLVTGLCLGKYHEIITENYIPIYYSRNFIFTGLPFFSIGLFIKKNEVFIQKHTNECVAMLAFIVFCIAGIFCNISFGMHNKIGDMYITTIFASISLFIFCIKLKVKENALSRIGRDDCLYIYILHPAISYEILSIIQKVGLQSSYQYFSTAIVLITTIISIRVLRKLRIIGNLI